MLNIKYILDVGSSCLRLLAVSKFMGRNQIVAEEEVLYDGYMDGEFLSAENLTANLDELINKMSNKMRKPIKAVVVGVPSEFCVCVCKRISRKFNVSHKITDFDVKDLFETNKSFGDSQTYSVINYSPMQFVLDDDVKTLTPIGMRSSNLVLDASYILAKRTFINLFLEEFAKLNIFEIDFICTALGQALSCEQAKEKVKPFAVVDVGHISTSVCVLKGEGLALLSSFSMGGGHISNDLMQILNLNFKDAELIKRKVILTVESSKNESYEVCSKGNLIKAPINMTNQIVKSRIEIIAKVIGEILSIDQAFKDITIYLTGDGISHFKGVKNIIKNVTGLDVIEFSIPFDNSKGRYQTSKIGLTTLAEIVV